jgi:PleD family two-component response regulator
MSMPKDVLTGFKSVAVDYITKHFDLQQVYVRVKTHLTLSASIKKLFQYSETDSLTGLLNRLTLLRKIKNEDMRFKQNQKSFPLFFADIDFFLKLTIPMVKARAMIFLLILAIS